MKGYKIRVEGIVQGVGFRPFIYRIAGEAGLKGLVGNDTEGVFIKLCCRKKEADKLVTRIKSESPPLAVVEKVRIIETDVEPYDSFVITESRNTGKKDTVLPPDTKLCSECEKELFTNNDRRYMFPFITCTHCGPRFSIIDDIPYDRKYTSMSPFKLCEKCRKEYKNPLDRRFHTEPVSCPVCGPRLFLCDRAGSVITDKMEIILEKLKTSLEKGEIAAIKGVGGFHLVADATNKRAVDTLRRRKRRPFKPFAVMTANLENAEKYLKIDKTEKKTLLSRERPIVLLKKKKEKFTTQNVSPGLTFTGLMLPYTPFQKLLFSKMNEGTALIMTSGNISEEPIVYREKELFEKLGNIADLFVTSNREIIQQSDDSVVFHLADTRFFIRRSKGFVPVPLRSGHSEKRIFASGADLKNCFALSKEDKIFISQYIGDLESPLTEEVYLRTVDHFKKIFDIEPEIFVSDMHPSYFSTKVADRLGEDGKRLKVQHHHAHIASVLEEHNSDEKVIGVAYDGTGYGTDGTIWGSEIILCNRNSFERRGHLDYFRLPGGEQAIKDVWKTGYSLLYKSFGKESGLTKKNREYIFEIIDKEINSPLCCSTGRLFDGISSILGVSDSVTAEAEAAMLLEEAAYKRTREMSFGIEIFENDSKYVLKTEDFVTGVVKMIREGESVENTAFAFHLALVDSTVEILKKLRNETGLNKVALSGGVFQNRILLKQFLDGLNLHKFDILLPKNVPFNDGCISLGQTAVAKKRFMP